MEILKEGTITIRDGKIWVENFVARLAEGEVFATFHQHVLERVRTALADAEVNGLHCASSAGFPTIVAGPEWIIDTGAPVRGDER